MRFTASESFSHDGINFLVNLTYAISTEMAKELEAAGKGVTLPDEDTMSVAGPLPAPEDKQKNNSETDEVTSPGRKFPKKEK